MSLSPIKKGINFSGIELFRVLLKVDFDALVEFLNSRGGLNGEEEKGRTALVELKMLSIRSSMLGETSWNSTPGRLSRYSAIS